MDQGKYSEACEKFQASNEEDPSPGALLNLGGCQEKLGKTASAWATYKEAATMARLRERSEQQELAQASADRLAPTLSQLEIDVPRERPPGFTLRRNSVELSPGSFGEALPADPGEYRIEASAPGYRTWTRSVKIGANADSQKVSVPALEKLPGETVGSTPAAKGSSKRSGSGDIVRDTSGGKANHTLSYILIGGGGAALIAGGVFGYLAQQQASNAEDDPTLCPDKKCTAKGRDEIDAAESKAMISTIGVGVGVAAIATGVVLLVSGGFSSTTESATRVAPLVGPSASGLSLSGRF